MTTARRAQLREIMQMAWSWFRQVGGDFADALRTAWRAHKVRSAPRVQLQRVKPGPGALSPLRETAFLAGRYSARRSAWAGARAFGG